MYMVYRFLVLKVFYFVVRGCFLFRKLGINLLPNKLDPQRLRVM